MVKLLNILGASILTAAALVHADAEKIVAECGRGLSKCPSEKPCCSQYGRCGVGAYCLGGCDPLWSTTIDSCVPAPVCQNKKTTFENGIGSVVSIYKYLGDATQYDWVSEGSPVAWNGNLLLTMAKDTVGTVVSSTHYVWYGKVSATLKTSRGAGVVSAFILFSGAKDEIDYEWVGVDLHAVQTNYYFQGIPIYTNSANITVDGDTYEEYHTYEIDWKPDSITWSVDGKVGRVKNRKDTWNETTKSYDFPQTPARVQLSLWPGGLASNAKGTIDWAGGLIDWNHPDVKEAGYYYATIKEINVQCYDPPAGTQKNGTKAYVYENESGLDSSIMITDDGYVLSSFLGTGTDMDKKPADVRPSGTSTGKIPQSTEDIETIPGVSGGGTTVDDILNDVNNNGTGESGFGDETPATDKFVQGNNKGTGTSDASTFSPRSVVQGSAMAVVIAIAFLVAV